MKICRSIYDQTLSMPEREVWCQLRKALPIASLVFADCLRLPRMRTQETSPQIRKPTPIAPKAEGHEPRRLAAWSRPRWPQRRWRPETWSGPRESGTCSRRMPWSSLPLLFLAFSRVSSLSSSCPWLGVSPRPLGIPARASGSYSKLFLSFNHFFLDAVGLELRPFVAGFESAPRVASVAKCSAYKAVTAASAAKMAAVEATPIAQGSDVPWAWCSIVSCAMLGEALPAYP